MFFPISEIQGWLDDEFHLSSFFVAHGPDAVAERVREFRGYVLELGEEATTEGEVREYVLLRRYLARLEAFAAKQGISVPEVSPASEFVSPDEWLASLRS